MTDALPDRNPLDGLFGEQELREMQYDVAEDKALMWLHCEPSRYCAGAISLRPFPSAGRIMRAGKRKAHHRYWRKFYLSRREAFSKAWHKEHDHD